MYISALPASRHKLFSTLVDEPSNEKRLLWLSRCSARECETLSRHQKYNMKRAILLILFVFSVQEIVDIQQDTVDLVYVWAASVKIRKLCQY